MPRSAATLRRLLASALVLLMLACAPDARSQGALQASEAEVKAAFLFKFSDYVEWPAATAAAGRFRIGVLDDRELADALRRVVEGKHVLGRPVDVQELGAEDSLDGLQMLFLGADADVSGVAARLAGRPILMVTEQDEALAQGGMINFVLVDGRVRFDAAPPAAQRHGLRISSRLLAVARRVREDA